ncbi:protein fem-1 homolog CG6966 [Lingula anatina]|uniref:Protein fem-1 homolog CG6966 n=1 Tax=Lingula anatina TaxID=7574 RepID=A0A1S3HGW0_LINAN|nr:protein fem-1 homolog CG6966 [Lingula anatina]|eukprot:XP_013384259.1 protein fem-1 homolog CG6966 [Lingula anatina]
MGTETSKLYDVTDTQTTERNEEMALLPKYQTKLAELMEQKNLFAIKEMRNELGPERMQKLVGSPYKDMTFVHLAVKSGSANILAYLVNECKADVCRKGTVDVALDRGGVVKVADATPLWIACQMGNVNLVKAIVWLGGDKSINERTAIGSTALQVACYSGHCTIVKFLIENTAGVEVNYNCLLAALSTKDRIHFEVAKYLLKEAHYNKVNEQDPDGMTLLAWCARGGNVNGLRLLIRYGAECIPDKKGVTPIMVAAAHGHVTAVKFLLEYGDNVNSKDHEGHDAVYWASRNGHTEIAKILLDNRFRKHYGHTKIRPASIFESDFDDDE